MEIELQTTIKVAVKFLEVRACVRYWEDATVNGVEDDDGQIPLRNGDCWQPVINLETGLVTNWPAGMTAQVHYKVCDAGQYWLQDADGKRVAKYKSDYVPDLLSVGSNGYGDYIILNIDGDGVIQGWKVPSVNADQWDAV